MTKLSFDQMRELALKQGKHRKPPSDQEHNMQVSCINWFRYKYPKMHHNLFAVPNGGGRTPSQGKRLKDEGVLKGVADLILLKSNRFYGALLIEMKTPKGRQEPEQREWQKAITADGYKYVICRSFDDFQREVTDYLSFCD